MKDISFRNKMYACFFALDAILIFLLSAGAFSVHYVSKLDGGEAGNFAKIYEICTAIEAVFLIVFMTYIVIFIMKTIRVNLAMLKSASISLADGSATDELKKIKNDEFGEVVDEFNILIASNKNQSEIMREVADGNLVVNVVPRSTDDLLGNSLKALVEHNRDSLIQIREGAMQVDISAGEVASASEALAQGSTEQASAIEQITASIDDVAEKTKDNAKKADEAANLMGKAHVNMQKGNQQMEEMVSAMNDINVSSENISKIIKVIDDIAFQTNILALNAAVEAARAGEAGMGFAVVAEEVRNLAAKSSSAAAETAEMIEDSIKKIQTGASIADDTMKSIEEISTVVLESESIIKGIAEASNYQATAIEQIDQAVSQVSQVVSTNSATSEECAAASMELSSQAQRMRELLSVYKLGDSPLSEGNFGNRSYQSYSSRNEQIISLNDGFGKY